MASTNTKAKARHTTHEGAPAKRINAEMALRRSLMACLLFEDTFYEEGVEISERLAQLTREVDPAKVAALAVEARTKGKLRHAPLLLVRELARRKDAGSLVKETLAEVIQRPDELAEFVSLYWKKGKEKLAAQVKKGLAKAFVKFNEYSLAKYNRTDKAVKLRDVLFLCHAKPKDEAQGALWKRLIDGTLATPDTWEVGLSATKGDAKAKRAEWTRLLREEKLGALALLRNLRNMKQAGVDDELIRSALKAMDVSRVLPFRFIAAANAAPMLEDALEAGMMKALKAAPKLEGKTVLVIDNSGSMHDPLSAKSDLTRSDAACALAILLREICEEVVVIGFGNTAEVIRPRHGFALREAIKAGPGGGTYTQVAVELAKKQKPDRIILVTDEQSHQAIAAPGAKGYVVNVGADKNGIGYGAWTHIDGFSEAIIDFIVQFEAAERNDK